MQIVQQIVTIIIIIIIVNLSEFRISSILFFTTKIAVSSALNKIVTALLLLYHKYT